MRPYAHKIFKESSLNYFLGDLNHKPKIIKSMDFFFILGVGGGGGGYPDLSQNVITSFFGTAVSTLSISCVH